MLAAVHPEQPSAPLVEALLAAGARPVPAADASAVADQEPEGGWAAPVVELGDDPAAALSVSRRVRADRGAPVLVVATRAQVGGLPMEACDDFLLSPIDPAELALRLRRLRALAGDEPLQDLIRFKDLELNLATYQARLGGIPIDLTYMEYELLRVFLANPNRVLSRDQLLQHTRHRDWEPFDRSIDIRIGRLRRKVEHDPGAEPRTIRTVRNAGYMYVPD